MIATDEEQGSQGLSPDTLAAIAEYDQGCVRRRQAQMDALESRFEALAHVIIDKRNEAITARASSGIEDRWRMSEEKYAGIDDANRHLRGVRQWFKGATMGAPLTTMTGGRAEHEQKRSVVFPRLSARYVDATWAKVCEMVLSPDDKSFSIEPTPVPDLVALQDSQVQVALDGQPLQIPATPGAQPSVPGAPPAQPGAPPAQPGAPPPPPMKPLTIEDLIEEKMAMARKGARMAEARIYDWFVEARMTHHARKVLFDSIRVGVGVLKGPYPKTVIKRRLDKTKLTDPTKPEITMEVLEEVRPAFCRVNPWNFFPDAACGDDPKNGEWIFERQFMSPKQVRALQHQKGYLKAMLAKAIKDGPKGASRTSEDGQIYGGRNPNNKKQFEIWYGYGVLTVEEFAVMNPEQAQEHCYDRDMEALQEVPIIVTLVEDTPVYVTLNPQQSGDFCYHTIPYIYLDDSWAGESLPERLDVPERILVGTTRALMNNAGVSAGSQIIMDLNGVEPADGNRVLEADKIWYLTNEAISDDVRKMFLHVDIPNKTKELMPLIEYALRLAEESSNLPLITQGFAGKESPETFGANQLQNSNAAQMLREIAHNFDTGVMEPLVLMCYEWLLLDEDVPSEEKGDWAVHAEGSRAMVERALQDQFLMFLLNLVAANPLAFDADLKKFFVELLKSKGLDPRRFQLSPDEKARLLQQTQQPPPQVLAAQIRVQGDLQKEQMRLQAEMQLSQTQTNLAMQVAQLDYQMDMARLKAETAGQQDELRATLAELELKKQIFVARYANDRGMSLEKAKVELATTSMKLNLQRELAMLKVAGQATTPAVEPAGKARNGEGFVA